MFFPRAIRWMSTNLKPHRDGTGKLTWTFDLEGVESMYRSYEEEDLWPLVESRPQGLDLNFVKVTLSLLVHSVVCVRILSC